MKLYRVTLKGFGGFTAGVDYKTSYVIASSADDAYNEVRSFLDNQNYGLHKDRILDKIELLAGEDELEANTKLFIVHFS